jgi:SAM-dependent methyltransferase
MAEDFFTRTPSPPEPPQKSQLLRKQLPALVSSLQLTYILDVGCGTTWLWSDVSGVQVTGLEISKPLVAELSAKIQLPYTKLQHADIFKWHPIADLWCVRDVLNFYPVSEFRICISSFLKSQSPYIALTSIETQHPNSVGCLGIQSRVNLLAPPLSLPPPLVTLSDGQQWFCEKKLLVYSRGQLEEWFGSTAMTLVPQESKPHDIQDKNAHLVSNVRLRDVKLHAHTGLGQPSGAGEARGK